MSDWDAANYHRVSDPQRSWGVRVLDRLAPRAGERILDIGCGTGRLTCEVLSREPSADLTALDRSWTMLVEASRSAGQKIRFVWADALALPFVTAFDAVFSTATFHWVPDHRTLFSEVRRVLRPGGRLVSQAGGGPNLARLRERGARVARDEQFATYFKGWKDPWLYAGVDETRDRLESVGFTDIKVSLEPAPTTFPDARTFAEFTATVCLRLQLERLPPHAHQEYLRRITAMAAEDDPPFTLDYWRLNIDAIK